MCRYLVCPIVIGSSVRVVFLFLFLVQTAGCCVTKFRRRLLTDHRLSPPPTDHDPAQRVPDTRLYLVSSRRPRGGDVLLVIRRSPPRGSFLNTPGPEGGVRGTPLGLPRPADAGRCHSRKGRGAVFRDVPIVKFIATMPGTPLPSPLPPLHGGNPGSSLIIASRGKLNCMLSRQGLQQSRGVNVLAGNRPNDGPEPASPQHQRALVCKVCKPAGFLGG
ncbi:hypothetical protein LX36DRAFT_256936 [Colletotrichum falcatum]|nr:hypothetical protein LX36DRAFT_256936 [Colletotrichum falcatum]